MSDSPAIGGATPINGVSEDQRGLPRDVTSPDIGAFELQPSTSTNPGTNPNPDPDPDPDPSDPSEPGDPNNPGGPSDPGNNGGQDPGDKDDNAGGGSSDGCSTSKAGLLALAALAVASMAADVKKALRQ